MKKQKGVSFIISLLLTLLLLGFTPPQTIVSTSNGFVDYGQVLGEDGVSALMISTDGKVYGGTHFVGHLFVYDPADNTIVDKGIPSGVGILALTWGTDGKLYGGGQRGYLWAYDPKNDTFSNEGRLPGDIRIIGLATGQNGLIYLGTETATVPFTPGRLFSFDPSTGIFSDKGAVANETSVGHGLMLGPDGIIYGGTGPSARLFTYDPGSNILTDKGQPTSSELFIGSLVAACDGKIYGGTSPNAHLFSYDPITDSFSDMGQTQADQNRVTDLTFFKGELYGATSNWSGLDPHLFKFNLDTHSITDLGAPVQGEFHISTLITAPWGMIYGGTGWNGHLISYEPELPNNFLELPFSHLPGNNGLNLITAYFDHQYPLYMPSDNGCEPPESVGTTLRFDGLPAGYGFHDQCEVSGYCYSGHDAIDYGLPRYTKVLAPVAGFLSGACEPPGSQTWYKGCWVAIDHVNGYQTHYWHLSPDQYIRQSGYVNACEMIGRVGMTGNTDGPHLHFVVRHDASVLGTDSKVDPYGFPPTQTDPWTVTFADACSAQHTGAASTWLWEFNQPGQTSLSPAAGGRIQTSWGFSVAVPAGAVAGDGLLAATIAPEPSGGEVLQTQSPLITTIPVKQAVRLSAVFADKTPITSFLEPATITLSYSDTQAAYVDETTIGFYQWNPLGAQWILLASQIDIVNNTIQTNVSSPGLFSLRGQPTNPAPEIVAISPGVVTNTADVHLTISGIWFLPTPMVSLGQNMSLDVLYASSTTLTAIVPAGLPSGVYTLSVRNPDGQVGLLQKAYTILNSCYIPLVSMNR